MAKRTVIDEEKDKFDKTKTGKAMNWMADKFKKGSPGNGAGSRVIKDDGAIEQARRSKNLRSYPIGGNEAADEEEKIYRTRPGARVKKPVTDINLPVEKPPTKSDVDEHKSRTAESKKKRFFGEK